MARKPKTEQIPATSPEVPSVSAMSEPVVSAPQAPAAPKPMSNIERVKLMNALAESTENAQLVNAFKSLAKGDQIFEIFREAVEREIAKLMGEAEEPIQVATLAEVAHTLKGAAMGLADFRNAIIALSQSPIMSILNTLHRNTGGNSAIQNRPLPPMDPDQFNNASVLHPNAVGHEDEERWKQIHGSVIY